MRKLLEHPIISAVIASLIVSAIGWMLGWAPIVWGWLTFLAAKLRGILTTTFDVPFWLILLFTIPLIVIIARAVSSTTTGSNDSVSVDDQGSDTDFYPSDEQNEPISLPEPHELSEEEKNVLRLLVTKDGSAVEYKDIKNRLGIPKLQAEQIIEALCELGILRVVDNYYHGPQIYLTKEGRDYVMGNDYKRT